MNNLRERLGLGAAADQRQRRVYELFGVISNPFPPASQPSGNPHMPTEVDDQMVAHLRSFLESHTTDAIVVEGTQGLGKTNLLENYQKDLTDALGDKEGYYMVKYYPDPEPDFGAVLRKIMQEFGVAHLKIVGKKFAELLAKGSDSSHVLGQVRSYESRRAFQALASTATRSDAEFTETAELLLEYLSGLRLFKRHTLALKVQFRLETTEAKTQALHDLVAFSKAVGFFEGLFLFLDELEKQDALQPKITTRYLSAIRALIDALPRHLFLVLAMTPDARRRYASMLPALAGRLETVFTLHPLRSFDEAQKLYAFYLETARTDAEREPSTITWVRGASDLIPRERLEKEFVSLLRASEQRGVQGITQRQYLDRLHRIVETSFGVL